MREIEKFDIKYTEEWISTSLNNLSRGDIFRIYDNGERYVDGKTENSVWVASGESYENKEGILTIDTFY